MEQWSKVLDGRYEVSNMGRIRNTKTKNILKTDFPSAKYLQITIWDKEKQGHRSVRIHRLVGKEFVENPDNKKFINHKNGDKKDCRAVNLEWVTRQENENHAFKTGLKNSTGSANVQSKLDENTVRYIKNSFNGEPKDVYRLVQETGVHRATIQRVLRGKIWNHVLPDESIDKIEREYKKGKDNPNSKLNEGKVLDIKKNTNVSAKDMANKYNVSRALIYNIRRGESWKHVKV